MCPIQRNNRSISLLLLLIRRRINDASASIDDAGPNGAESEGNSRPRRSQPADAAKDDTRMDQVLQTAVRWLFDAPVDRGNPLLYCLLDPGDDGRRTTRR